jgi:hypothetical protein
MGRNNHKKQSSTSTKNSQNAKRINYKKNKNSMKKRLKGRKQKLAMHNYNKKREEMRENSYEKNLLEVTVEGSYIMCLPKEHLTREMLNVAIDNNPMVITALINPPREFILKALNKVPWVLSNLKKTSINDCIFALYKMLSNKPKDFDIKKYMYHTLLRAIMETIMKRLDIEEEDNMKKINDVILKFLGPDNSSAICDALTLKYKSTENLKKYIKKYIGIIKPYNLVSGYFINNEVLEYAIACDPKYMFDLLIYVKTKNRTSYKHHAGIEKSILLCIKHNPKLVSKIRKETANNPEYFTPEAIFRYYQTAIDSDPMALRYISKNDFNESSHSSGYYFYNTISKYEQLCFRAVKKDGRSIKHVDIKNMSYHMNDIFFNAIDTYPASIRYYPGSYEHTGNTTLNDLYTKALCKDPMVLEYIPKWAQRTLLREHVINAVKKNLNAFKFINFELGGNINTFLIQLCANLKRGTQAYTLESVLYKDMSKNDYLSIEI